MPKPETRQVSASGTAVPSGCAGELAHRFDQAERAAGRAGLPDRKLPARGVVRKRAVVGEAVGTDEIRPLAFLAEAEILKLHHDDDRIVVIGLDEIDVARLEPSHRPELIDIERPAAAHLHRIVRKGIVPLDGRQDADERQIERLRRILAAHQERLRARARHHAVEQMDRIGDRPRRHVFVQRQLLLHHRVRNRQRVVALRDAELGEVLAPGAVAVHVILGDQRERRVGAAGAVRIDGVLGKARKRRQRLAERIDMIGIGGDAGDDLGVAGLHRARRAAQRHDAARAAKRNVIEPARRQAEMLGQPDRGVRRRR